MMNLKGKGRRKGKSGISSFKALILDQKTVSIFLTKLNEGSYYKNFPIKPGVDIYRAIVESKLPLSRLKVKIPETLATFDTIYWIGYDYLKGITVMKELDNWNAVPKLPDRSEITPETKYRGYVDTLEYIDTVYYQNFDVDRNLDPACL